MAKNYAWKFPIELYYQSRSQGTRSSYYTDAESAEKAKQRAIDHNKEMGYLFPDPGYQIRPRVPISRAGSGRKKEK